MARKEKEVPGVTGRDIGKTFLVREMPTIQGEKFAARALLALSRSGVNIPPDLMEAGWRTIAQVGILAFAGVSYFELEPLLDEMRTTCMFTKEKLAVRPMTEDDVEEVETLVLLRRETLGLHVDFSQLAARWKSLTASKDPNPSDMQTSPPLAES